MKKKSELPQEVQKELYKYFCCIKQPILDEHLNTIGFKYLDPSMNQHKHNKKELNNV